MLGHIMEWFYYSLAGIGQSESSIAYKDIVIRPEVVGDITYAKGTYRSLYGPISSEWRKNKDSFELTVMIPANTTATIFLPVAAHARIFVDGRSIKERKDVQLSAIKAKKAIIKPGSGIYRFSVN